MTLSTLRAVLDGIGLAAIAVSGGVDSLTLAAVACAQQRDCIAFHAVSPAVPERATQRVRALARDRGWKLTVIDAGEFADAQYRSNPINRCFHCKARLYNAIAARADLPILSGTNLDDLQDFRPGLDAARAQGVRHPFVDARMTKNDVRRAAQNLGLASIADLPAAPCLSSRVTTGIPIDARDLHIIEQVEEAARGILGEITFRCRLTHFGFQLAIDESVLCRLRPDQVAELTARVRSLLGPQGRFVGLRPYRKGSAFVGAKP